MAEENQNKNQVSVISEDLSKRINSLRFLLIVFVVIIHSGGAVGSEKDTRFGYMTRTEYLRQF